MWVIKADTGSYAASGESLEHFFEWVDSRRDAYRFDYKPAALEALKAIRVRCAAGVKLMRLGGRALEEDVWPAELETCISEDLFADGLEIDADSEDLYNAGFRSGDQVRITRIT